MLVFTNRIVQAAPGPAAFTRRFRPASEALSAAVVERQGATFSVDPLMADIDDDMAMQSLVPLFGGARPLLLYVHGNNNTPASCFERCARLQEIYDIEVIGFSWPSEGFLSSGEEQPDVPAAADGDGDEDATAGVGPDNQHLDPIRRKILRYQQAKLNAQRGVRALARLLRLLASARLYVNQQPVSLAVHSLGAHHLQHTLQVPGVQESLGALHNVVLLAPCCRAEGHAAWLQRMRPRGQTFITFNQADWVLYGACFADNGDVKLGADPGPLAALPQLRYIDFTGGVVGAFGHGYFVRDAGTAMPKRPRRLFGRLFGSASDLQAGESPGKVYVQGCRADGVVCWMGNR